MQVERSPSAGQDAALVDLCDLSFDNSFVRELPADPVLSNVPRAVRNACYTRVDPTPVPAPQLLAWADAVGELLRDLIAGRENPWRACAASRSRRAPFPSCPTS